MSKHLSRKLFSSCRVTWIRNFLFAHSFHCCHSTWWQLVVAVDVQIQILRIMQVVRCVYVYGCSRGFDFHVSSEIMQHCKVVKALKCASFNGSSIPVVSKIQSQTILNRHVMRTIVILVHIQFFSPFWFRILDHLNLFLAF